MRFLHSRTLALLASAVCMTRLSVQGELFDARQASGLPTSTNHFTIPPAQNSGENTAIYGINSTVNVTWITDLPPMVLILWWKGVFGVTIATNASSGVYPWHIDFDGYPIDVNLTQADNFYFQGLNYSNGASFISDTFKVSNGTVQSTSSAASSTRTGSTDNNPFSQVVYQTVTQIASNSASASIGIPNTFPPYEVTDGEGSIIIGVSVGIGVPLLGLGGWLIYRRRRRNARRRKQAETEGMEKGAGERGASSEMHGGGGNESRRPASHGAAPGELSLEGQLEEMDGLPSRTEMDAERRRWELDARGRAVELSGDGRMVNRSGT